jgi:AcrR family transcriptional regulator
MVTARTLRERIRAEMSHEIKAAASRQLAEHGAAALSLRAVARELGLASSALYRYFKSRDDLLTALIIDAYDSLGQAAEDAEQPLDRLDLFGRWSAVCHAVRRWALDHPHEYALIYGSPVPGYRAPQATVGPASRVTLLLARIAQDAVRERALTSRSQMPPPLPGATASVASLAESILSGVPEPVILAGLMAWLEIFGAVSFELFGQLNSVVSDNDAFFDHSVRSMASLLGLQVSA